jgi:LysR family transcriptional regulator for bpeEF and oprC
MDKIAAMRAFARVVEAGTFVRAADSMDLPNSTVTRLVQTLEQELGAKLLNRTTRRVTVTGEGAMYYERALRLLGDLDDLEASLSQARASPRGRLRVDLPASLGLSLILPSLPDFCARYPEIELELGLSDRPVDLIADNVDCVVRGGVISDQSLVARRIGEARRVCCASPDYVASHGLPVHPSELQHPQHALVRFVSPRTHQVLPFVLCKGEERFEVQACKGLTVNDTSACVAAAVAGLGVADALEFLAEPHLRSGALLPVLLDWCSEAAPLYVVYPENRHLSNKVRVFIDWVAALFAGMPVLQGRVAPPCPVDDATLLMRAS